MGEDAPILQIKDVTKQFGKLLAVNNVSLDIIDGEFFTIVGPSGSGKTTLLRMLAVLDKPTGGDILLRGNRVNDVSANKRPTCMVFQSLALFNHRTVGQNIEFSQKMKGIPRAERRERAMELMKIVRLPEDYYAKSVTKCSGGERQRVALARALAFDPDIMFFDEPLSAIDYQLRKHLEVELKDLHRETGKTFMYITHSLEEAMVMSDRIGIMQAGHLIQVGTPDDIYTKPLNKFVSEFMGEVNTLAVYRGADNKYDCAELSTQLAVPTSTDGSDTGYLVIRPESMRFLNDPSEADNHVKGSLFNEYGMGSRVQYHVRVGDSMLVVEKLREQAYQGNIDDDVIIGWNVQDSVLVSD